MIEIAPNDRTIAEVEFAIPPSVQDGYTHPALGVLWQHGGSRIYDARRIEITVEEP